MVFIDEVRIQVASGKGGDGVVHFRREKYIPFGGPDGGDGGRGGDVVLEVKPNLNSLFHFQHKSRFKAQDGARGGGNNRTGKTGEDLVIYVAPGTVVYDDDTGEMIGDLVEAGERLVITKGGRGGRGNARFATSRNQAPRLAERGEPGQERSLHLELRLIADVGIIGVPNAGKSTLLSKVTNARPKIAPYPFTTLEPNLGVCALDDETSLVLADIPGLIEGAHEGVGLGHNFLRHIQRTRVLIHLLDGVAEDPALDYIQINSELSLFDPGLADKPQLVALNKIDLPEVKEKWQKIKSRLKKLEIGTKYPVKAISALTGEGVQELMFQAAQILDEIKAISVARSSEEEMPVYRVESDPRQVEITRISKGWKVSGQAIERAAAMTYWEYDESVRRFQRILHKLGIEDALREAGVQPGESVFIGDHELEWQE